MKTGSLICCRRWNPWKRGTTNTWWTILLLSKLNGLPVLLLLRKRIRIVLYKIILPGLDRDNLRPVGLEFHGKDPVFDIVILHKPFSVIHIIQRGRQICMAVELYDELAP